MDAPQASPHDLVAALRERLGARAAGWWRVVGEGLEQVAFAAAADMPEEVARAFANATLRVPLALADLGIVRAARSGAPAISRADALPDDAGSGLWLRRFAATRSVAVPVRDGSEVVSAALGEPPPDDEEVVATIRAEVGSWPPGRSTVGGKEAGPGGTWHGVGG